MGTGTSKWYTNISILLVVLISLLGVMMAGLMLLLVPKPSDVLRGAVKKMVALDRFHIDAHVEWRGERKKDASRAGETLIMDAAGFIDSSGEGPYAASWSFAFRPEEKAPASVQGEMRRGAGSTVYRFSSLPENLGSVRFGALKDTWLRVDSDEVLRRFDLPLVGAGRRELGAEEVRAMVRAFIAVPFVSVRQYINTEQFAEGPVYHYAVDVEPLFIKDTVVRADEAKLGRPLTDKERGVYDDMFADHKVESAELWIDTHDHLVRRAVVELRVDDDVRSGRLRIDATFSKYGEKGVMPVPTEDVSDATPIVLSLLPGLAGGRLPVAETGTLPRGTSSGHAGLPVAPAPGEGDADADGLSDLLERFYGSDSTNPDTDGDGVSDGAEVERGLSPTGPNALFDFTGGRFR